LAGSILAGATTLLRDFEALLLPVACLGCGDPLNAADAGAGCCAPCRSRMRAPVPPLCGRCGQPRDPWDAGVAGGRVRTGGSRADGAPGRGSGCGFCRDWPPELAWAGSAVRMEDGPARELVHALKYGGWRPAAHPMAEVMARGLGQRLMGTDILVPVPLGRARLRDRGYNQAAVLAAALGRLLGIEVADGALSRTRETRSQTSLGPAERWRNVRGAFASTRGLAGARVAVVDDVLTTGATLAACAAAVAAGGAKEAGAATFARAAVPT
jgi:ComF family protein